MPDASSKIRPYEEARDKATEPGPKAYYDLMAKLSGPFTEWVMTWAPQLEAGDLLTATLKGAAGLVVEVAHNMNAEDPDFLARAFAMCCRQAIASSRDVGEMLIAKGSN